MNTLRSVLLVEDNPMDLELTIRALTSRRMVNPIEVARDGEEAMAWQARYEQGELLPLVVLLDLKLPRIDGLDVLKRFKASSLTRTIPVVVLTSSAEERDIRTACELGANSYIVKPVSFERFLEVASQIEVYWCALNRSPF